MEGVIGEVKIFAGNFAPRNWAFCHGQLVAISENQALFAVLGTTYGGDGRTNFALPDCRGRTPIGAGQAPGLTNRLIGQRGGVERVTLAAQQMPAHDHPVTAESKLHASGSGAETAAPGSAALAEAAANIYIQDDPTEEMAAESVITTVTIESVGGSQAHDNMQPWIAMNWIICLEGVFPDRS